MGIWIVFFSSIFLAYALGDSHQGRNPVFWKEACEKDLHNGCYNLHYLVAKKCTKGQALMCAKQAWMIKNAMGVDATIKKYLK